MLSSRDNRGINHDIDDQKVQLLAQVAALEIREGNAARSLGRAQAQIAQDATAYATLSSDLTSLEQKHHDLLVLYHTATETAESLKNQAASQTAAHTSEVAGLKSQLDLAKNDAVRFKKLFQIAKKQAVQLDDSRREVEEEIAG